jgi:glycosyltransferase involved in cell wall biosynthesis
VREVIEPGVTGLIVNDMAQAIEATRIVEHLDRRRIRDTFERRFSARRMAQDYVELYEGMAGADPKPATVAA